MSSERDIRIDMLRTIALFCIMLAHVNPPPVIFDIRNFDVVWFLLWECPMVYQQEKKDI